MGIIGQHLTGADKAPERAANIEAQATEAATAEQRRQYDLTRADYAPWLQTGRNALSVLGSVYGLNPSSASQPSPLSYDEWAAQQPMTQAQQSQLPSYVAASGNAWRTGRDARWGNQNRLQPAPVSTATQAGYDAYLADFNKNNPAVTQPAKTAPDYTAFFQSPDYQFRLNQGLSSTQNSLAARGGAMSGNALKALNDYGQGMASSEFGNWYNRMAGLAGIGQSATNSLASVGQNTATNIGNNLIAGGNARASGITGTAAMRQKANADTAQTAGTIASYIWFGGR